MINRFKISLLFFIVSSSSWAENSVEPIKLSRNEFYAALTQLNYRNGTVERMPEEKQRRIEKAFKIKKIHDLNELDNKLIQTDAYGVPLKMEEFASEFMMVGDSVYCSHVEPPPPNQVVHVKMKDGVKGLPIDVFGDISPLEVIGRFKIIRKKSEFGSAGFEMIVEKIRKI